MRPTSSHRPMAPGVQRADTSELGQYLPVTPETHPGAFRSPEETNKALAQAAATMDRLDALQERDRQTQARQEAAAARQVWKEKTPEEQDDPDDSDYREEPTQPTSKAKRVKRKVSTALKKVKNVFKRGEKPATAGHDEEGGEQTQEEDIEDVIVAKPKNKGKGKQVEEEYPDEEEENEAYIDSESESSDDGEEDEDDEDEEDAGPAPNALSVDAKGWKYLQPVPTPLTYYVHANTTSGFKVKTIRYEVDFNSRESVNKANKTRRLEIKRGKERVGIQDPLKRPSTKGREYTQENDDWIVSKHDSYAADNDGEQIPLAALKKAYNRKFPGERRTEASILSHIYRIPELKNKRDTYSA